jgi:two-component sensor histidine kinase
MEKDYPVLQEFKRSCSAALLGAGYSQTRIESFGVVLHELLSNSFQHDSLPADRARRISFQMGKDFAVLVIENEKYFDVGVAAKNARERIVSDDKVKRGRGLLLARMNAASIECCDKQSALYSC